VRPYRSAIVAGHSGGPALADIARVEARQLTIIVLTNQQLLHPLLAEAILDTYLPAPPSVPARNDDLPAIAANIRAAVMRAAAGEDASAYFALGGKEAASSLGAPFTQAMLRGMGPLGAISLIEVREKGERRYRLDFAYKTMTWLAIADAQGKLTAFRPD
jgi:hypothetical protein